MRKLFLILMTLMACTIGIQAQTRTIHGTVVDAATNEPLIGATVMPIGGGQGAAADIDGKFTLTVPSKVKKATVSYVGYTSQTVDLTDGMTVKLQSSSTSLDDVIVVAYGTANKESLTGSVAVVGSKEIEERPVTSVTAALEGNAPGVQVNNSVGYPGSAPEIRIRGFNTINGSNSPLYVVDGIPYDGSISELNPADIESMSVLKDAASSALYGNRGANGVVLITTKKAKGSGKVEVNLTMRQGMYNRGLPFYDRLDANEFMQAMFTGLVNGKMSKDGFSREAAIDLYRNQFFAFALSNIYGKTSEELFNENGQFVGTDPLPGYNNDLDWWKAVSRSGYRQEYNVNAVAATEKFDIFASAGYLKENGYMLQTDFERFNGRINANFQPVKFFRMGLNLQGTHTKSNLGITSKSAINLTNNPFSVLDQAPIYPYYAHDDEGNVIYDEIGQPVWNHASYVGNRGENVAETMRLDKKDAESNVIDGTLYGTAFLPYGFELTVRGSIHRDKSNSSSYQNNITGSANEVNGALGQSFGTYNAHTFMQTLNWAHDYGNNHVDVLLDHENYQTSSNVSSVSVNNQLLPGIYALSNFACSEDNPANYSQDIGQLRSESYLGRVRYNWDQKYFGEFSFRRDGSSYFEKDLRWGNFWSVGASWVISKEKFMQDFHWMNYLKLRTAYGSVGNDASAGMYSYYNIYEIVKYGASNTLIPVQLASNNLKWEATRTFDIGLEGSLFNDRFNFSVGYFNKRNVDLIFTVGKPLSGGTMADGGYNPSVLSNIGTMQNIGWELQFGYDIIRTKDLSWNFNIDATFYKNKIVKLPDNQDQPANGWYIGKSLYEMATTNWIGIDNTTGQSLYEIDPESPQFLYYDGDGNAQMNRASFLNYLNNAATAGSLYVMGEGENAKYYTTQGAYATTKLFGTTLPTVYGSFGTNVSWKGINLGLLFTYSLGGKTYDSTYAKYMNLGTQASATHKDILKSWTQAPENAIPHESTTAVYKVGENEYSFPAQTLVAGQIDANGIPQINSDNASNNNWGSSRWILSASYLTLKNVNLTYDLPAKWMHAMNVQNIRVGCSIDNVFIAAKRKGVNPQYSFGGGQGNYYVPARVFSFQLDVKF